MLPMRIRRPLLLLLALLPLLGWEAPGLARQAPPAGPAAAAPVAPVVYRVAAVDPAARTVRLECTAPLSGEVTFALPRWIPGYYARIPLRRFVSGVRGRLDDGRAVPLREDARAWTWTAAVPEGRRATLSYTVRASEDDSSRGITHVYVSDQTAFVLPVACAVYVQGEEERPCELRLDLPAGWKAAVPLAERDGGYQARSYHEFADSPLELGRIGIATFRAAGRPARVVLSGQATAGLTAMAEASRSAIEAAAAIFGGVPFADYTAGYHSGGGGGDGDLIGGLEHARSATMTFGEWFPLDERNLRGKGAVLVFHETFHAWNVKSLRPAVFAPYRYDRLPACRTLWFAEGFTDYYGAVLPRRSGFWKSNENVYAEIERAYNAYLQSTGRRRTSLRRACEVTVDSSVYGEGEGTSYYDKGMLVGLLLDLQLRSRSGGQKSLDDVMRWLYARYAAPGPGYPDDFMAAAIRQATGLDLASECHRYLETADDLPLAEVLATAGLRVTRSARGVRITESPAAAPSAQRLREAWLATGPTRARRAAFSLLPQPGAGAGD
jgi:predicted metalloprotease with PDZ domain